MKKEKISFLRRCSQEDQEKLLGKRKMTFEDYKKFTFLAEYYGFEEYAKEIYDTFAECFQKKFDELLALWKQEDKESISFEELEEDLEKIEIWIREFGGNEE